MEDGNSMRIDVSNWNAINMQGALYVIVGIGSFIFQSFSPLFIHLAVRTPAEQEERNDDQDASHYGCEG